MFFFWFFFGFFLSRPKVKYDPYLRVSWLDIPTRHLISPPTFRLHNRVVHAIGMSPTSNPAPSPQTAQTKEERDVVNQRVRINAQHLSCSVSISNSIA